MDNNNQLLTVREIISRAGISQAELCRRYRIPRNTLTSWVCDPASPMYRNPPQYIPLMLADCLINQQPGE